MVRIYPFALLQLTWNNLAQTVSACLKPSPGVLGGLQPVPGSCGILLPGMEARILREDGSDAEVAIIVVGVECSRSSFT